MVSARNESATNTNCITAVELASRISAASRRCAPITGTTDWTKPSASASTKA